MKYMSETISKIKSNYYFFFVYFPSVLLILIIAMLLLCYPDIAAKGVSNGIETCIKTLIPALFPFMFFSSTIINSGIINDFCEKLSAVTYFLFDLPGICVPIIIMSLLGGYPIGALLIKESFENGKITASQGRRMLLFCVNPGPAFTISVIGVSIYGSVKTGIIIYLVTVLSSLISGFLSRFFEQESDNYPVNESKSFKPSFSDAINLSINSCVRSLVNICAWVIIFSCLSHLISSLPLSNATSNFIITISEVTNGVLICAEFFSLPVLCAVIGFSGFCIHLQIMPTLMKVKLKYKHFLCSRIISASINCVLCFLILKLYPYSTDVISIGKAPESVIFSSSIPLCVFLMISCGLYILGDNYVVARKEKNIRGRCVNKPELY